MAQSPFIVPLRGAQPRQSVGLGREYGPQRQPRPKGRYDTPSLFSKLHFAEENLMIPGAFGSEITRIPQMDEVLRRRIF
jgi:hypothetical protein